MRFDGSEIAIYSDLFKTTRVNEVAIARRWGDADGRYTNNNNVDAEEEEEEEEE